MQHITSDMLLDWAAYYIGDNDYEMINVIERLIPMTPMTPQAVLDCADIDIYHRCWVLLRPAVIPAHDLHALACQCAADVLPIWADAHPHDARPREAIEAKRRWLRGEITDEALESARAAARAAEAAEWAAHRTPSAWAAAAARDALGDVSVSEEQDERGAAADAALAARAAVWAAAAAAGISSDSTGIEQKQLGYVRAILAR